MAGRPALLLLLVAGAVSAASVNRFHAETAVDDTNYEENEGLFEGDMIINEDQNPLNPDRNARIGAKYHWPHATIPYTFKQNSGFDETQKQVIAMSMVSYQRYTCIRWIPRTTETDYVEIFSGNGCYSEVGKHKGKQRLSLKAGGCTLLGIAEHEMMHAAGFYHEQSRTDRDEFVTIFLENVKPGLEGNFRKFGPHTITDLGTHYDYGSIMHYSRHAFSKNGRPTILPKQPNAVIGQRFGFSFNDVYKLNKYYNCSVPHNIPGPIDVGTNARECNFDSGFCGWTQDYRVALDNGTHDFDEFTDEFDWMRLSGPTHTSNTGPNHDHTGNHGHYIVTTTPGFLHSGSRARIRSPLIQGAGDVCISFWYNMWAARDGDMGTLRVFTLEKESDTGRRLVWSRAGRNSQSSPRWDAAHVDFSSPHQFQVIFEGQRNHSYRSDIAIDDFSVRDGRCVVL